MTLNITKKQLKEIIKEEMESLLEESEIDEGFFDRLKAKGAGLGGRLKAKGRGLASKGLEKIGAPMAAGELAGAGEQDIEQAMGAEASSLLSSHSKKVSKTVDEMIYDAEKLGLTKQPQMLKAMSAVKAAVTRLNNLLGS